MNNLRLPMPRPAAALLGLALLGTACSDQLPTESRLDEGLTPSGASAATAPLDETPPGWIRIGVIPAAESVAIGSPGAYEVFDKATGNLLMSGSGGEVTVTLVSEQVVQTHYRLQVMCSAPAAVEAWRVQAEALGHVTYLEPIAACTRAFIGEFPSNASFSVRNAYRNQVIAQGLVGTDSFWKLVTQISGTTVYGVARGAESATSTGPVVLKAAELVTIGGAPFRGIAEVRQNRSGTLAGVNELKMEEYLYGVVPRELPPVPYGEIEALKAQAVAARTYAYAGLGKRKADGGYDLLTTTSDQVYGGYAAEHPLSSQAVDETAGVVATFEGKLIQALYSSTSGGHTADSEEAYNSAPVPYLRGKIDAQRGKAPEHVPSLDVFRKAPVSAQLRSFRGGDYEADWSRYHRWSFEWTMDEITQVISAYAGQPVGKVTAINVLERGPSGRVLHIEYVTEAGTFSDTKDRIRSSLKFVNASGTLSSLLSTLFFIEPVHDPRTKELVGFKAYGGGWGHGVGLSQTGAVGRAEKGESYEEILKHYYTGIELERR